MRKNSINIDKLRKPFSKLTSFNDKIAFWEDHKLDFKKVDYVNSEGYVALSIQPNDLQQRVSYNKWILSRWRDHFLNDKGKKLQNGSGMLDFIPQDFEKLRSEFNEHLSESKLKSDFIRLKLKYVIDTIGKVAKNQPNLPILMHEKFKAHQQMDLFYFDVNLTITFVTIRQMAQLWDLIEFRCYLEMTEKSFRRSTISELHFLKIEDYTEDQLLRLWQFLKDEHYIAINTSFPVFSNVFNTTNSSSGEKVLWIDRVRRSKNISRQSLIELIVFLLDYEFPPTGLLYKFLSNYFSTEADGSLELNYENFRKCYHKSKNGGNLKDPRIIHLKRGLMGI